VLRFSYDSGEVLVKTPDLNLSILKKTIKKREKMALLQKKCHLFRQIAALADHYVVVVAFKKTLICGL